LIQRKNILKRSFTGLEIEVQTLSMDGYVINESDKVISECRKTRKDMKITKECSKSMVELGVFPSVRVKSTAMDLLENLQDMLDVAEKMDIVIYPLSVYPGQFQPIMRKKKWYEIQRKLLWGNYGMQLAGKTSAFHFHYTLPKGVFDKKKKFLKPLVNSKTKKTLIDSYNLAIAMDPALVTLFESSPMLNGKYLAKDSRVLIQRTGKAFPYKGIYSRQPKLAGLPIYKATLADLVYTIRKRHEELRIIFENNGLDPNLVSSYGKILEFSWHAVRINKIGTLEQRSMDMNHPKYVIAGTVMLKYIFRKIQQDFLDVVASDVGLEEPFKVEGNTVHIPPHTYVRKRLQYLSAYEGFENPEVRNYCRRFFSFAKRMTDKEYYAAIKPFEDMIKRKQSVSDVILKKFRKKGYTNEDTVPDDVCAEVALSSCEQMYEEIEHTKKTIEGL